MSDEKQLSFINSLKDKGVAVCFALKAQRSFVFYLTTVKTNTKLSEFVSIII